MQMTCQKCVDSINNSLTKADGIKNVEVFLDQGSVIVETNLPHTKVQELIENTGRKAVLKGYGGKFLMF